ncbi:hypothetical protein DPX16_5756 [Anabarilius grahami]|uniref:Uncharacterized protein n=1 Tax=Anabarilius grahami TaxID=495550 RepID=A0A3N0Z9Y7_ANAGA|nr:hypothetical protein DPX16_5756 [Anabarilius grahami]
MAPMFEACRLASLLFFVISVFLSVSNCYSPLVYDRQLLLDIRDTFMATYNSELGSSEAGSQSCFPNLVLDIPDYLRRWPYDVSRKKRRRRRGKRGGAAVKLKMEFSASRLSISVMRNPGSGRYADWRWLDPPARWLRPIIPDSPSILKDSPSTISRYPPIHVRRGSQHSKYLFQFHPVEDRIHHASMDALLRNCATGCRVDEAFTMDDLADSISADTSGLRCGPVEDRIHHAGMDGLLRNCGTGCRIDEAFTMDDLC